jgi:hypothetical protein
LQEYPIQELVDSGFLLPIVNPDYYAMWFALKIEYTFPMEFLSLSPCKNIAVSVERVKLTRHQNRVRIEGRMDISKVTGYLYVGSRVGKEHADELKVLDFDLITPISIKELLVGIEAAFPIIQIKAFEKHLQTR